jgi:hypothetical protein
MLTYIPFLPSTESETSYIQPIPQRPRHCTVASTINTNLTRHPLKIEVRVRRRRRGLCHADDLDGARCLCWAREPRGSATRVVNTTDIHSLFVNKQSTSSSVCVFVCLCLYTHTYTHLALSLSRSLALSLSPSLMTKVSVWFAALLLRFPAAFGWYISLRSASSA